MEVGAAKVHTGGSLGALAVLPYLCSPFSLHHRTAMGKALQRRNLLLKKRMTAKLNARKAHRHVTGLMVTREEQNRAVLADVLKRLTAEA